MATNSKTEHQLLKEFRKLSPETRGELFEYLRWLRSIEAQGRLRRFKNKQPKRHP